MTTPKWSIWRLVGSVIVIAFAFLATQTVGVIALAIVESQSDPAFDAGEWLRQGVADGDALVAATLSSTLICVPLVIALVGPAQHPWHFLRVQRTSARTMLVWCGVLLAAVAASDLLTLSTGRPIVPDEMVEPFPPHIQSGFSLR